MERIPGQTDLKFVIALSRARMSQRKLGDVTGISHSTLSLYRKGRYILDAGEKELIAKALGMKVKDVFTNWSKYGLGTGS